MTDYSLFIDGAWAPSASRERFGVRNPYTCDEWATVPDGDAQDVDRAVSAAFAALTGDWALLGGYRRSLLMLRLASIVERDAEALATVESRSNGKLLRESLSQVNNVARWLRYFAGIADKLEGRTIPSDSGTLHIYTTRVPVGVVAAITPWNSPLQIMTYKLAPAWAAGCPFVLKPSDLSPASALEFAKRVEEAGFPPGAFNVITTRRIETARSLVSHPGVSVVAFTGSTQAGREVAQEAGKMLTDVVLELGGKSAQIVFDDAAVAATVDGLVGGVFAATGQTCVAGSRLLVHERIKSEVVDALVARARTIRLGDPMDPDTEMGPLISAAQRSRVVGMIERAERAGASVLCGGATESVGRNFVGPTVITDVDASMEISQEEVFGPVISVMGFSTEAQAIAMANSTRYGLAAGIWTRDIGRAHRIARQLDAGSVWINCYRLFAPYSPFGGFRSSGLGRENGQDAVESFLRTQAVWVESDETTRDPFVIG